MAEDLKYVIVQAGGKGARMEGLTCNRPKVLVPVNNLPMIFHLFKKYPEPYYPVNDEKNGAPYHRYRDLAAQKKNRIYQRKVCWMQNYKYSYFGA